MRFFKKKEGFDRSWDDEDGFKDGEPFIYGVENLKGKMSNGVIMGLFSGARKETELYVDALKRYYVECDINGNTL